MWTGTLWAKSAKCGHRARPCSGADVQLAGRGVDGEVEARADGFLRQLVPGTSRQGLALAARGCVVA